MPTKMTKCVHCGDNALTKNDAGQPTCNDHSNDKPKEVECPVCGKDMQIRSGQYGYFWGCEGYPECQTTKQISDAV